LQEKVRIQELLGWLDRISGGRLSSRKAEFSPLKTSNLLGKSVRENPGLVWGDPLSFVKRVGLCTTCTENAIELAHSLRIDLLLVHHPVADGASSGGVPLKTYLELYNLALIELHEAYHGLHPGIPWLHGHRVTKVETSCGGKPGNLCYLGENLPEVTSLRVMIRRLKHLLGLEAEEALWKYEQNLLGEAGLGDAALSTGPRILLGAPGASLGRVIHIFPHTGFVADDLQAVCEGSGPLNTVIASISRVEDDHPLVQAAEELNLNFVLGNCHPLELLENWLPLGRALEKAFPKLEVIFFKDRLRAYRTEAFSGGLAEYAELVAAKYLSG